MLDTMVEQTFPRYTVNTSKIVEVILWLANAKPDIDVYHVVKCAFFADKLHLAANGRPVTGDDYVAAPYGPLGRCLYGLLRGDPMALLALELNGPLPFVVVEPGWVVRASRDANLQLLSKTDVEALRQALDEVGDLSFADLVERTHDEPAYRAARGGLMNYADLLDDTVPDRAARVRDLSDTAGLTIL